MPDQPDLSSPYVFFSYAGANRERAFLIADLFEAAGVRVWIDRQSIAGGTTWTAEIVRGIEGCTALVLLSSAAAMASRNVRQEIQLAWETNRPILPLLLEKVRFPEGVRFALAGRQWIEVLDLPEEVWLPRALRALEGWGIQPSAPASADATLPPRRTVPAAPARTSRAEPFTSFIGREREVAAVRSRLLREDVRLLTLTGPGGTGKTRLALRAATEDLLDHFPHGVVSVDLTPLRDPDLVASAIAQALGVQEAGSRPLVEKLKDFLRDKQLLLVLDNFEQVIDAAPLVVDLLGSCPRLKILVTSRAVLHVSGEHNFAVPPLILPNRSPLPSVEELSQYEAVRLFLERAQAVKSDFVLTNDNAPAVVEICHRLDGLPLAIELAAARTRLLSPQALLARLEHRLPLLTGGARDLPTRQQTLRDTIAWSFDLLDEGEQQLFRRLAVFAGGCTLEAIETVCNAEGNAPLDPLEGVAVLVDQSLLRQSEQPDGEPRFMMLDTIREYGLAQLEASGEAAVVRGRHADFFLGLFEDGAEKLRSTEQLVWLDRLEREQDNMRTALTWSREDSSGTDLHLRLASSAWWFWNHRAHFSEGRRWLEGALVLAESPERREARLNLLLGAGVLASLQGDSATARARLEEGLTLGRHFGDKRATAYALNFLGWATGFHGSDYTAASPLLAESVAIFRDVNDKWGLVQALTGLAWAALGQDDYTGARSSAEEAAGIARKANDWFGLGGALLVLGRATFREGDYAGAEVSFRESLRLLQPVGMTWLISQALLALAWVAYAQGSQERAARLFGTAEALLETIGSTVLTSLRSQLERSLASLRSDLGGETFAVMTAEGRAMTLEQATAYALSNEDGPGLPAKTKGART